MTSDGAAIKDAPSATFCESKYTIQRILNADQKSKFMSLLATRNDKNAVLLLEKLQFDEEKLVNETKEISFNAENSTLQASNDIYSYFFRTGFEPKHDVKATVIYPATDAHIAKYSRQARHMIIETPEIYQKVTKPFIDEAANEKNIGWMVNILEHGAEADKVLFRCSRPEDGFFLLPDSKWDQKNVSSLYLLAICTRRDVRSLRDLTAEHLPLLRRMQTEIPAFVTARFGVPASQLKLLVHYQPTYYHFHVHVIHTANDGFAGASVGQSQLLNDIVDGIATFGGDFWQRRTIAFALGEQHALFGRIAAFNANFTQS